MSKHYDILTIKQYLTGELDALTSHQLERDALEDPMLQDAIDGFEHSANISAGTLSLLQQRLESRVANQQEKRNTFFFGRQRLAIASIAGVMFILACTLFWMINYPLKKTTLASSKEITMSELSILHTTLQSGDIEPKIGWDEYNHYLSINHTANLQGEVTLSFQVLQGRPVAIEVKLSTNDSLAKELITLLQEGPSWNGTKGIVVFN